MEIYETEEQQVDAIKSFWAENGNAIIAGLVVGFGGFIGFNYYKDAKLASEVEASDAYQAVIAAKEKDNDVYKVAGDKFIQANADSSYTSLTALSLAKDAAEKKDWAQVSTYLNTAIKKAPSEGIKAIAITRLARVQIEQGEFDAALATMKAALPVSFKATVEEIKGDAYLKQGKKELARNAYQAAIDADGLTTNPSLQLKFDDLAQLDGLTKTVQQNK